MKRLAALGLAALVTGAVCVAVTSCGGGCNIYCAPDVLISSPAGDLRSVSGCDRMVACSGPACSQLIVGLPNGGDCTLTVTFLDGSTAEAQVDWFPGSGCGAYCGAPSFDFHLDASVVEEETPPTFPPLDAAPEMEAAADAPGE